MMATYDTKAEVLNLLDTMTRELEDPNPKGFTTANIANRCHISRSLASQYLNELVRQGDAVKVNSRPVAFFHRKAVERYLQAKLSCCEYDSMEQLLNIAGINNTKDFDKAIGFELSYKTCIDHLKSAIQYPPHGIPAILVGEHGTGKRTMSELAFEYGVNTGALPPHAKYVYVDCACFDGSNASIEQAIFGGNGVEGAVQRAVGGVVFISAIDHLTTSLRTLVLQRIQDSEITKDDPSKEALPVRFLLSTSRSVDSDIVKSISRYIPIVVPLSRLSDRSVEERTSLVMHFLRLEGRRVGADVRVSRGALRALVNATFQDNIDGLRSCITSCCASAYLNRGKETLTIRTYNLPSRVLATAESQPDDDQLIGDDRGINDPSTYAIGLFQKIIDPLEAFNGGSISFTEFFASASMAVTAYNDYVHFESERTHPRIDAYERMVSPAIEEINRSYGIELTRRVSRSVAQSLYTQLWGGVNLMLWRRRNAEKVKCALAVIAQNMPNASTVAEQVALKTKSALGIGLDSLSLLILLVEIGQALKDSGAPRDYAGVIVCHGYATATSIADAANRILRKHVYEAIDMTYDQDLSEITGQLARLLDRYTHCKTIALLVDTGSLETLSGAVSGFTGCDIHMVNNVSTGLAVEMGSALIARSDLEELLLRCNEEFAPHASIVRCSKEADAVVFCSESGVDAADKIRLMVQNSLPGASEVQLITCDFSELSRAGERALILSSYRVRAIVGTMDPGVSSVPFVGLEDILYQGSSDSLDKALFPTLNPSAVAGFHANLLRNLTLRSVIESITILNPEMLYMEADRAVKKLSDLSGEQIDARRRIGVYVHLCGLIERLVTKSFVDSAPDIDSFVHEHADFVRWFREAFSDMSKRYRVEIPISEIVYVHHMLHVSIADDKKRTTIAGMILEDE